MKTIQGTFQDEEYRRILEFADGAGFTGKYAVSNFVKVMVLTATGANNGWKKRMGVLVTMPEHKFVSIDDYVRSKQKYEGRDPLETFFIAAAYEAMKRHP